MKRFFHILAVAIVCAALSSPSAEAQGRNGRGSSQTSQHRNAPAAGAKAERGNNKQHAQGTSRSSGSELRREQPATVKHGNAPKAENRPANTGSATRPGNGGNGHNNNGATRPGNNGNDHNNSSATRPGNNRPNEGGNSRPANNGSNRPGNNGNNHPNNGGNHGGGNNFAPGGNGGNHGGPGAPGAPNHRPGNTGPHTPAYGYGPGGDRWHGNFHDIPHHAPHRPMLPPPPPHYYRPVPPPAFRPAPHAPSFGTILGVALGSAINYTLNQLFNSGYYVSGYTNSAIYLNDVLMLNLVWPNATLQYSNGRLAGSEFVYLSPFYNTDRYYQVYNTLQSSYGLPVSMDYLSGGGMQATWFGLDGRYVSLTYQGGTAMDGQLRYYTTLSFGN